jgi:hypothetical protein
MKDKRATVKAAWILAGSAILVALIGLLGAYISKKHLEISTPKTDFVQNSDSLSNNNMGELKKNSISSISIKHEIDKNLLNSIRDSIYLANDLYSLEQHASAYRLYERTYLKLPTKFKRLVNEKEILY